MRKCMIACVLRLLLLSVTFWPSALLFLPHPCDLGEVSGPRLAVTFPPFAPSVAAGDSFCQIVGEMERHGEKIVCAL